MAEQRFTLKGSATSFLVYSSTTAKWLLLAECLLGVFFFDKISLDFS